LDIIAVANQGDGCERGKGQRAVFFLTVPDQKALDRAFVTADRSFRAIIGLEVFQPTLQREFGIWRNDRRRGHGFSPVSVFSPVFFWR
jgi:hypothetical protein